MKKFIIILVGLFIGLTSNAQREQFMTSSFSIAEWSSKENLYVWSDWVVSNCIPVDVDINNRLITIRSEQDQDYVIVKSLKSGHDGGGKFDDYSAVDQDGKKCIIKTRVQDKGRIMQLCIYYDDVAWAYCIERRE